MGSCGGGIHETSWCVRILAGFSVARGFGRRPADAGTAFRDAGVRSCRSGKRFGASGASNETSRPVVRATGVAVGRRRLHIFNVGRFSTTGRCHLCGPAVLHFGRGRHTASGVVARSQFPRGGGHCGTLPVPRGEHSIASAIQFQRDGLRKPKPSASANRVGNWLSATILRRSLREAVA